MYDGFKALAKMATHYLAPLLCCSRMRPHLGNDKACGTKNLLPQPLQSAERLKGTIPYWRRILSWDSSYDKSVSLKRWVIAVGHAPFSIFLRRRFITTLSSSSFRIVNSAFYENSRCFCPAVIALRTNNLCNM